MADQTDDDRASRLAILARRRRFIALALTSAATAVGATACACLQPIVRDAAVDARRVDGGEPDGSR